MNRTIITLMGVVSCLLTPIILSANWINFNDETSTRLTLASVPLSDGEEKDISVADINNDGWTDVICVRRNPFSVQGPSTDLLLLNDQGVLRDSTQKYAPGFIATPSDARDVIVHDLDSDGWLDVFLVNTFGQQPIYYHNLGNNPQGQWLGLVDSSAAKLPLISVNPIQFCAGWAGDINGDNAPDIYLSNYNPSGGSDDVLLINDGSGNFTDESAGRLGSLRRSAFGTSCEIYDMDNDGDNDVVKISTLYAVFPWFDNGVYVLFNDGTGNFSNWQMMTSSAPYMFTVGDLTNDGRLDMYVIDDNQDYVNIATGFDPDTTIFHTNSVLSTSPRTTQFGGNVKMIDLDNDGDLDVGAASADLDIPPCESGGLRKFALLRNDGVATGTLSDPYGTNYNLWNEANYDFGFIDINNDGKIDIFNGRCSSYEVYMHEYLAVPGNLLAVAGFNSINLSWDPNQEAFLASYALYRSEFNQPDSSALVSILAATDSTYIDGAVLSGQPYYYWLRATDTLGFETGWSNMASATYSGACIYTDSNSLNTTNVTPTSVTLNWTPEADAERYDIRGKVAGSPTWVTLSVVSVTGTFDVTGLFPGTTFIWQLKKVCQSNPLAESGWTPLDTFSTLPLPPCMVPNPVSTSNVTSTSADLNWTAVPDALSYTIFGQVQGSSGIVSINVSALLTTFSASGLTPSTTYGWAVVANCSGTQTPVSNLSTILAFTTQSGQVEKSEVAPWSMKVPSKIRIAPNPTTGRATISWKDGRRSHPVITVRDISGKVVGNDQVKMNNGTGQIHMEFARGGVYLLSVADEHTTITEKVIVLE